MDNIVTEEPDGRRYRVCEYRENRYVPFVRKRDDKLVGSQLIVSLHHDLRPGRSSRRLLGREERKSSTCPIAPMTVLNSLYATEVTAKPVWQFGALDAARDKEVRDNVGR